MYKWLGRIRRVLRLIYEFFFIVLIINLGICLSGSDMMSLEALAVLAGLLVVSYIARDLLSHAISLFIVHVILGVIVFFILPDIYMKIILDIALFGIFIDGAMYMKRGFMIKRAFDAPGDVLILGIAVSMLAAYLKNNDLQMFGYVASIIMLVDYLISLYIEGLDGYLVLNRNIIGLPMNQMISINSIVVTTVIAIIIVMIILADFLGLPKVIAGFFIALLGILKILVIIFDLFFRLIFSLFDTSNMNMQQGARQIEEIAENDGILSKIGYFIIVAVILSLAVYILIRLCRFIIKWLISKQDRGYEMTENINTKKKKRLEKAHIEKAENYGINSFEQKARRIYKKKVLSFRRFFLPDRTDTAGDIETAMMKFLPEDEVKIEEELKENENKETLTEMYEAVRYGNKVPDRNYLRKMKQL
ncbi:hypothetical protein SAMN06297422_11184 [Lachnospiraceae bacterium]|nr:hypothetical protein SAMN06297422_11184 [Lachnospiraceae bacterium]